MKKSASQTQVKTVFQQHKNGIVLTCGYLCAVAAAFLPLFAK